MKLTENMKKLIEDCRNNGYTVEEHDSKIEIYRCRRSNGTFTFGLTIWESGEALRNDTDWNICTVIRTQKEMRKVLGI